MKKVINLFVVTVLILSFAIPVFAAGESFVDQKAGIKIEVPSTWRQTSLSEERNILKAKFVSKTNSGVYACYGNADVWSQIPLSEKWGMTRKDTNTEMFSKEEYAKLCGEPASAISSYTIGGNKYYQYIMHTSTGNSSTKLSNTIVYSRIENGWLHIFYFYGVAPGSKECLDLLRNTSFFEPSTLENLSDYADFLLIGLLILCMIVFLALWFRKHRASSSIRKAAPVMLMVAMIIVHAVIPASTSIAYVLSVEFIALLALSVLSVIASFVPDFDGKNGIKILFFCLCMLLCVFFGQDMNLETGFYNVLPTALIGLLFIVRYRYFRLFLKVLASGIALVALVSLGMTVHRVNTAAAAALPVGMAEQIIETYITMAFYPVFAALILWVTVPAASRSKEKAVPVLSGTVPAPKAAGIAQDSLAGLSKSDGLFCPKCGHKLPEDSLFCSFCGTQLPEPSKHCPSCGEELPDDAQFCHRCGTRLEK